MNSNLLLAILAMDSFNQGYAPGLEGDRPVIGPATRIDIPTPDSWKTIGFYAVAYRLTQAVGDLAAGVAMRQDVRDNPNKGSAVALTLQNFAASTCSQAVRFVLHEKGLSFEDYIMNSPTGEYLREPYLSLNPNGVVPTLVHDGEAICDSTVIMEYLDEIAPEPAMVPPDALGRAKMREWLRYFEEVPHPSIRYPSFHYFIGKKLADKSKDELNALAARHPIRKDFYSEMNPEGFTPDKVAAAEERLAKCLDRVEKELSTPDHGGPWLMGAQLTVADACLMPVIDRMNDLGMAHLWEDGARLRVSRWYAEIQKRPAFAATYYTGTRLSENYGAPRNR